MDTIFKHVAELSGLSLGAIQIILIAFALLLVVIEIFRRWPRFSRKGAWKFRIRKSKESYVQLSTNRLNAMRLWRSNAAPESPIVVSSRKGKVRRKLYRLHRVPQDQEDVLWLSDRDIDRLLGDDFPEGLAEGEISDKQYELNIRQPHPYGPLQLWNHPDMTMQISVRLAVIFLAFEILFS